MASSSISKSFVSSLDKLFSIFFPILYILFFVSLSVTLTPGIVGAGTNLAQPGGGTASHGSGSKGQAGDASLGSAGVRCVAPGCVGFNQCGRGQPQVITRCNPRKGH